MAAKAVAVLAALLVVVAAMGAGAAPPPRPPPPPPQCNVYDLSACGPAFVGGAPPSQDCCDSLRREERKGCLCKYARDQKYSGYLDNPRARKALAACKVAYPKC